MKELEKAIKLRKEGRLRESNISLIELVERYPDVAKINYQYAWSLDLLNMESDAAIYYERAIELGLPEEELKGAFLGLGSTYRVLGEYHKSKQTFEKGMEVFKTDRALQVFYAMTLYNLNHHAQAMEILLRNLIQTSTDESILSYKNAVKYYMNNLDEII